MMSTSLPYSLVLVLQAVCVLHVLKTGRDFKWIYLIMFIPVVGAVIYFAVEMYPALRSAGLPDLDLPLFLRMRIARRRRPWPTATRWTTACSSPNCTPPTAASRRPWP